MPEGLEDQLRRGGRPAVQRLCNFVRGPELFHSFESFVADLDAKGIRYAIAGSMAMAAHGCYRGTELIELLVSADQLAEARDSACIHARQSAAPLRLKFLISGQFPGNGEPTAVAFPDPADASIEIDGVKYLRLPMLIELKLTSGMTGLARINDLADAQEMIHILRLPREFVQQLHPHVREKFLELWATLQEAHAEPECCSAYNPL